MDLKWETCYIAVNDRLFRNFRVPAIKDLFRDFLIIVFKIKPYRASGDKRFQQWVR